MFPHLDISVGEPYALDTIQIPVTLKELASSSLLKNDFNWKPKTKLTSKEISEADKDQELTTSEVRGVRALINRIKEFFKGKGEK